MDKRTKNKVKNIVNRIGEPINLSQLKAIIKILKSGTKFNNQEIERYIQYIFPELSFGDYVCQSRKYGSDSSSLESHIARYGKIQGTKLFNDKLGKTDQSLSGFIRRYGKVKGTKKYESFVERVKTVTNTEYIIENKGLEYALELNKKKSVTKEKFLENHSEQEWNDLIKKKTHTLENFKELYGEKLGSEKWEVYKSNSIMYGDDVKKNQIGYWVKLGYSESEAKDLISGIQSTFSLNKCIEKYGFDDGTSIWSERQTRWQETMKSKTSEEIAFINKRKGANKDGIPHVGRICETWFKRDESRKSLDGWLYYYKFTKIGSGEEYWKIGITQRIDTRWGKNVKGFFIEKIFEEKSTLYEVFTKEQSILKKYAEHRKAVPGFGTEFFTTNVLRSNNENN